MKISTYFLFLIPTIAAEIYSKATAHKQGNLVALINKIYYGINATTLVIFNYETKENEMWFSTEIETETKTKLWHKLEQPILLLQNDFQLELVQYFNARVLTVVLKMDYLNALDWQHFGKVMKHLTRTDVLFVSDLKEGEGNSSSSQEMWNFFRTAWEEGYLKVLLSDFQGEKLYSCSHFPVVKVEVTTVPEYLMKRQSVLDAHGYPIRSNAGNNPPRSFVYFNDSNEMEYRGLAVQLITNFAQHYNFSIDWLLKPNFETIDMTDCLKYLQANSVDICSEFLPFNRQSYTIASPFYITYGYALVPYAPPLSITKYLKHPFYPEIWWLIAVSIIATTAGMSLVNRFKLGLWQVSLQFMRSLKFVLYISAELPAQWGLQKLLIFFIFIPCTFVLSNLYHTFLTSILTSNLFESQINSLEELKQRHISILITDSDMEILSMYNSFEPISDNYLKIGISSYVELRNSLNNKFAYINLEDKCEFYLYQQKFLQRPRLRLLPKPLSALWSNIPMADNWPFMDLFNHYILTMFDTGIIRYLQDQAKEDGIRLGYIHFIRTEHYDVVPLNLQYFEIPGIILAGGCMAGLVCFSIENIIHLIEKIKMLY